jgi:hypothetical protein
LRSCGFLKAPIADADIARMETLRATPWHALVVAGVLAVCAALLGLAQLTRAHTDQTHQVQRVVKTYEVALMTGDGDRACAQLTPAAQRQLVRAGEAAGLGSDCRQVALAAKAYVDRLIAQAATPAKAAEVRQLVTDPPVQILAIDSRSATARLPETVADAIHLTRGDDGWRITELSFRARG